jgi:hypothetical protein
LPPHSLYHFAENNEQFTIITFIENSIVLKDLKDTNEILEIISRWKIYTGGGKETMQPIELALIRDFILDNYGHLTLDELELAYLLAMTEKLSDCEYFGNFSALYVGKVLNAYLYYRKMQLADPIRKRDKAILLEKEKKKPSPEEEAKLTQEIFLGFYSENKEKGEINDVFNLCWKFVRNQIKAGNNDFLHKWTNPQKEQYNEAMNYASKKLSEKENNIKNYFKIIPDKDEQIKKIARNYCIQRYFDDIKDIQEIIKKIKPNLF